MADPVEMMNNIADWIVDTCMRYHDILLYLAGFLTCLWLLVLSHSAGGI